MDTLIIFAIIWAVGKAISALAGKKNNGGNTNKQRQAVEEQQKRREAYELAQREQQKRLQQSSKQPPKQETLEQVFEQFFGTGGNATAAPKPATTASGGARRVQRPGRMVVRPAAAHPKTVIEAQRPLYAPAPAAEHHIDEIGEQRCAEAVRVKQEQRQVSASVAPAMQVKRSAPSLEPAMKQNRASLQGNALVQGIIMAEILGPPRAKKRQIR